MYHYPHPVRPAPVDFNAPPRPARDHLFSTCNRSGCGRVPVVAKWAMPIRPLPEHSNASTRDPRLCLPPANQQAAQRIRAINSTHRIPLTSRRRRTANRSDMR